MRILYFGTYQRDYPRNAQVISCLRRAGVEVEERHEAVWDGRRDGWKAGALDAVRLAAAEARLLRGPRKRFDAVVVGYPGHLDLPAAKRAAGGAPVVFNPLVSLEDTFVADRGRFRPGSAAARALAAVDRYSLRAPDLVVADTRAHADHLAELAGLDPGRVAVCLVGAEERVFQPGWTPTGAVHVPVRRQTDPAARPGDDPRGGATRPRDPVPRRRLGDSSTRCSPARP